MMADPALITALGTLAAVAVALAGVWVKLVQAAREFKPNSGTSLKDAVDRIEDRQRKHGERLARVETTVKHLSDRRQP